MRLIRVRGSYTEDAMRSRMTFYQEDRAMLFIVNWTALPEVNRTAAARFLQTGGAPPDGIRLIGRWHGIGSIRGFAVCESDQIEPMAKWAHEWADLFSLDILPALTDEQAGKVLAEMAQRQ
jgi:hypothetical protein